MTRALIVEQNSAQRTAWLQLLTHEGLDVEPADTYDQAHALVQDERFDMVLVELGQEGPRGRAGLLLTETIKKLAPTTTVVILSDEQAVDTVVEAMRKGASDFVVKGDGAKLHIQSVVRRFVRQTSPRQSKIVCTIGKVTESEEADSG